MIKLTIALLILCSACSTPTLLVRQGAQIQRLGISFESGDLAMPMLAERFEQDLDEFILRYNATPKRKFDLYRASSLDSASLRIALVTTQLVKPGQQTAGILVSAAGLSLPFVMASAGAPFYLFFYYFPNAKSLTELSLSPDIADPQLPKREYILSSPGFLKSPEKQIDKHVVFFDRLLTTLVSQIEKQTRNSKPAAYVNR